MKTITDSTRTDRLLLALAWLLAGLALLLLTPMPAHTATLGWAPALWLVGAPALLVLVMAPRLPLRLLACWARRR